MAAVSTIATIAAAVVGAGAAASSARNQRRAAAKEKAISDIQNLQERKMAIKEQRRQAAVIEASAASSGASGSSGEAGAIGSLTSSTFANIGVQQSISNLNSQRLSFMESAARDSSISSTAFSVAKASGEAGGYAGVARVGQQVLSFLTPKKGS